MTQRNISANTSAISIAELNKQAKSLLENSFISLRVQGEISNFAKPSSGHWYFTLKDSKAQVRCAMFKGSNRHVNFKPSEGTEVIVQAKVTLYEGRGDFQLICETMEEAGSGRLQLAFEQLKAKLNKEGLFDSSYKIERPSIANHLAIITSATGAAVHDILSVLNRRYPSLPITIYPTAVQGEKAADEIVRALKLVEAHDTCDLIILGRGGGSLEDLWPFNEEKVARAIFRCPIPTISAVGHEVDFSISDLVADYRAATPSAAAELISPDQNTLRIHIDNLNNRLLKQINNTLIQKQNHCDVLSKKLQSPQQRLTIQQLKLQILSEKLEQPIKQQLDRNSNQLTLITERLLSTSPMTLIEQKRSHLKVLSKSLQRLTENSYQFNHQKLHSTIARLNSISPLSTLSRGYSIVQDNDLNIITSPQQLSKDQEITIKLDKGTIKSKVTHLNSDEE